MSDEDDFQSQVKRSPIKVYTPPAWSPVVKKKTTTELLSPVVAPKRQKPTLQPKSKRLSTATPIKPVKKRAADSDDEETIEDAPQKRSKKSAKLSDEAEQGELPEDKERRLVTAKADEELIGLVRERIFTVKKRIATNVLLSPSLLTGGDVVKKSSLNKDKFLFAFSGTFRPKTAGQLGTLERLDTVNPVLYFSFPQGRLKYHGVIVHPKTQLHTVECQKRIDSGHLVCTGMFEKVVLFTKYTWVGTKEENPEEKELPFPDDLFEESQLGVESCKNVDIEMLSDGEVSANEETSEDDLDKSTATPKRKPFEIDRISSSQEQGSPVKKRPSTGKGRHIIAVDDDDDDDHALEVDDR